MEAQRIVVLSSGGYCRTCDMITTIPKSIPYEEVIMGLNKASYATHFSNNTAKFGGAMSIYNSNVLFNGSVIMFRYNSAYYVGGAIHVRRSRVTSSANQLFFSLNIALSGGGGLYVELSDFHSTEVGNMYFFAQYCPKWWRDQ